MMRPGRLLGIAGAAAAVLGSLSGAEARSAAQARAAPPPVDPAGVAPVPFGPGERLEYQVKLGVLSVGDGHMSVEGVENVRGYPSYHVVMAIKGGIPFARVEDEFQSWMDVRTLVSRRFVQDQHEVRYKRFRQFEFYPEERRWIRADRPEESGDLHTSAPLDDISFVYFARTLPLEVGKEYHFDRYFKEDGNPVVIKVLRKDRVEVPAGTFNTIVVQPIIKTDGLFGEGGRAELHFSDDDRRLLVQMKSRVPVVGHLSLHLREITEGTRLVTLTENEDGGS